MDRQKLIERLKLEEGLRLTVYVDTRGNWTIGYGHKLDSSDHFPLTQTEAENILENDVDEMIDQLAALLPWWLRLDPVRQLVLADMAFELGVRKLLEFKNTLRFVQIGNYAAGAGGMRASLWAKQVPNRAEQLAHIMETGVYEQYH